MKKVKLILLFILIVPMFVKAKTMNISETNIKNITVDDTYYICDKTNYNTIYGELGITDKSIWNSNKVYGQIIIPNSDMEFIIEKEENDTDVQNLLDYDDESLKEKLSNIYKVYSSFAPKYKYFTTNNNNKFLKITYYSLNEDKNNIIYFTIDNNEKYYYKVKKSNTFTSDEESKINNIIESVIYKIDEPNASQDIAEKSPVSNLNNYRNYIFIGVGVLVLIGFIIIVIMVIRNNKKNKKESTSNDKNLQNNNILTSGNFGESTVLNPKEIVSNEPSEVVNADVEISTIVAQRNAEKDNSNDIEPTINPVPIISNDVPVDTPINISNSDSHLNGPAIINVENISVSEETKPSEPEITVPAPSVVENTNAVTEETTEESSNTSEEVKLNEPNKEENNSMIDIKLPTPDIQKADDNPSENQK